MFSRKNDANKAFYEIKILSSMATFVEVFWKNLRNGINKLKKKVPFDNALRICDQLYYPIIGIAIAAFLF